MQITPVNTTNTFKGLNMSNVSANDLKWLQSKPWWAKNKEAISVLAEKYDIEIASGSQNIGIKIPNNISILNVRAQKAGTKTGLFGTKFGTACFDIDLYDVYKKADKTLLDTVNRAIKDIRFWVLQ